MFQKWLFGYSIPASKVSNEILFLKSISERDGVREDVFSAEKNFGLWENRYFVDYDKLSPQCLRDGYCVIVCIFLLKKD